MKIWYPLALLLLLVSCSKSTSAQNRMDLGLRYEIGSDRMIMVQYRVPISPNFKWNIAAAFLPDLVRSRSWQKLSRIIDANDTLVTERQYRTSRRGGQLTSGLTLQLPWKLFSISADLVLGVRQVIRSNYNRYFIKESGSNTFNSYWRADLGSKYTMQEVWSLRPGIRTEFQMNLPINKRLKLNLSVTPVLYTEINVTNTVTFDPLDEFQDPFTGFSSINFDLRAGIGLQYSFGKGKVFGKRNTNGSAGNMTIKTLEQ
ncbi:hypothetical protein JYT74_00120 [Crocinitomix catalasitica]|nr:hypothetical protein [Crocinitomix catalasitica]